MDKTEQLQIYKTWLEAHKSLLFKVILIYADTETDREDLFQEISIQVWRSVPNFRKEAAVTTWLYRVALNTAIKWNRVERKHQVGRQAIEDETLLLQKNMQQRDERLDWLYEEIGKLDVIDRSLCLLLLDGFSYVEMSDILGISESNVGVKIHRVKKYLIAQSKKYNTYGI